MGGQDPRERRLGVLLVTGAVLAWSTTGLFVRLTGLDAWTILYWRGLFGAVAVAAYLVLAHGRGAVAAVRRIGAGGCLVAGFDVAVSIAYIGALALTTVADVALIYATVPLVTAALARLCLGERAAAGVVAAGLLAVAGVAIMVGGAAAAGAGSLAGNLLAIAMTLLMAAMVVLLRRLREVPMVPAALLSALATAAVAHPFATPGVPDGATLALLALFGAVQMALGLALFVAGSRRLPPAEAALLTCLEAPLAPLLVWLALGEAAGPATLLGGAIVLAAVAGHLATGLRGRPRAPRTAATQAGVA